MRLAHFAFTWFALAPIGGIAGETVKYPRVDLLIEPAELSRPEVAQRYVILDASIAADYKKEHVPGARWVDHEKWSKAFEDGKDAKGGAERIGELGIAADSKVVVYDRNRTKDAARIWWILRYWGVADVRLLNGGWKTWRAESRPTTDDVPAVGRVEFKPSVHPERLAEKGLVLSSVPERTLQIVDARSEKEFCGIDRQKNKRAGAIPGAKQLEWSDLLDEKTDRFKSPDTLRRLFKEHGIDIQRPTITHCQSGGRASVMAFGLELMGADSVRNYYRGWEEWGNQSDTPITTPKSTP